MAQIFTFRSAFLLTPTDSCHLEFQDSLLTSKQLPAEKRSWKDDLFAYRKRTIELLFQRLIQSAELKECRVKGEGRNGAFVLANVWVYQICFLTDFRAGKPIACIKEHLDCARWRVPSG